MHLRSVLLAMLGIIGVAMWLLLLEVTDFSSLAVSAGLMGGLFVTGTSR